MKTRVVWEGSDDHSEECGHVVKVTAIVLHLGDVGGEGRNLCVLGGVFRLFRSEIFGIVVGFVLSSNDVRHQLRVLHSEILNGCCHEHLIIEKTFSACGKGIKVSRDGIPDVDVHNGVVVVVLFLVLFVVSVIGSNGLVLVRVQVGVGAVVLDGGDGSCKGSDTKEGSHSWEFLYQKIIFNYAIKMN